MNDDTFSLKTLSMFGVCALICVTVILLLSTKSGRIVFCDVGNGDAIYIRTLEGTDIVIDAGRGNAVLACLGKEMPWFDKKIEYAMVSHPHNDHYGGFESVFKKYSVDTMIFPTQESNAFSYQELLTHESIVTSVKVSQGVTLSVDESTNVYFLWPPSRSYTNKDPNAASYVAVMSLGTQKIVFTGDATPDVLDEIALNSAEHVEDADVLKVPHHGSAQGLTENFLQVVDPTYAVISAGRDNSYGHPSPSVISMLEQAGVQYAVTAEKGSVRLRFNSDGKLRKQVFTF